MASRTLTISSVGKSFSFTGWKIGCCKRSEVIAEAAERLAGYRE